MQYLYTFKTRYGVVHADLGPIFMLSSSHLQMLWAELVQTCRARDCQRALVERSGRFQDLRATELGNEGNLICGLDGQGLRMVFCFYQMLADEFVAAFTAFAATTSCTLRRFETLDDAMAWVGRPSDSDAGDALSLTGQDAPPTTDLTPHGVAAARASRVA